MSGLANGNQTQIVNQMHCDCDYDLDYAIWILMETWIWIDYERHCDCAGSHVNRLVYSNVNVNRCVSVIQTLSDCCRVIQSRYPSWSGCGFVIHLLHFRWPIHCGCECVTVNHPNGSWSVIADRVALGHQRLVLFHELPPIRMDHQSFYC